MKYFSMALVVAAFGASVWYPEWYTAFQFVATVAAYCYTQHLAPQSKNAVTKDELDQMKRAIETLADDVKSTGNKLAGVKMQLGLRDR